MGTESAQVKCSIIARFQVNKSVAVVGCGYWGKNLVRVFATGALWCVCDTDAARLKTLAVEGDPPVHRPVAGRWAIRRSTPWPYAGRHAL